ncbi:MAG: multiheme c-type cytochrome [Planctomycetaceae bacterium]
MFSVDNPAGYLGPEKCAACHRDRVHEFRSSRHYLACVPASDDTMPSEFLTGQAEYTPHNSPVTFRMNKEGNQFLQIAEQKTADGVRETRSPISLIYGFGAETDEIYFSWKEDKLSELPVSWLHPDHEWGTSGFDRLGTGDFSRPTNPRCIECHNTWLEHIPGTPDQYRPETLIAGVTCEVCHGPGKEHVSFHERHPDTTEPMHILRPSELSRNLKMDLCANCHSNAMKHRGPAFSYRPGQPLAEFYRTLTTRNPEDDHVANQTSYLQQSKCYQESDDLTCITCHDPHTGRDVSHRGTGTSACLNCHEPQECEERPRLPVDVQDNCVGCHMPKRTKIQVYFDTKHDTLHAPVPRWDHRIAVNHVARDEVLLAWHKSQNGDDHLEESERISASLASVMDQEGDQCLKQYRYLAAVDFFRRSEAFQSSNSVRQKRELATAKQDQISRDFDRAEHDLSERRIDSGITTLEQLLIDKPNLAKAHGRLGTFYAFKRRNDEALERWSAVVKYDPDDAYGEGMIGWHWYLQNQPEKALTALMHADEIEPWSFRVNFNLALTLLKLDRPADALDRFQRANRIKPQDVDCAVALNAGLRQAGRFREALELLEQLSKMTERKNLIVEIVRADSLADAGQMKDAVAVLLQFQKNSSEANVHREISNRLKKLQPDSNAGSSE